MNPRKADFSIDPIYLKRWSPRSFEERDLDEETLYSLFEAARWAPSGNNRQPWRFIIARTAEQRETFYQFINEGNLKWCKRAPVLALIISEAENEEGRPLSSHAFDAGTAWGFLALEATRKGLITHAMGGFDKAKAKKLLGIPDRFVPHAVIAIGYQGSPDQLAPEHREREHPSDRRPLSESLFDGTFGQTLEVRP